MFEKRDEQLVAKARNGDKKAWFTLIQRYEQPIYQYGIRMTGNTHDAADLMQDIFVSVFKSLSNYRGEGAFRGWLFKIAHYRCMEFYRRKRPQQSLDECPEQISEEDTPEIGMLSDESSKQVLKAMQKLSVAQKAVVELKFFHHFTFDEIAQQLGLSSNTVKSRLYSALNKLKLDLEVENA
ncbi:sigma-70 family RNA polymerase sigma factor [Alteromonas ponticola]|uniref:Sigma-70 family RNA polymerase sigma factor n=1 Tax=Alteromonas aquimaris TaxID=2998417 RepID=A0ABT3P9V6_9ALTE|nr:sigma-70 family RNA polymerase sigma factor [Alteromonas aquimaris]MCW8109490.1 sigma-70 family RNA polymerase sigma factor [Alteromonas aquimaris]